MNIKKSLFVFLIFSILSACTNASIKKTEHPVLQKSKYADLPNSVVEDSINVEMKLEHSNYKLTTDELTIQIKNKGDSVLLFGAPYYIEKFKDGSWYEIPFKNHPPF